MRGLALLCRVNRTARFSSSSYPIRVQSHVNHRIYIRQVRTISETNGHIMKRNEISAQDLNEMRKPYKGEQDAFDVEHLAYLEPFGQFQHWFDIASKTDSIHEANAMALATSSKEGVPSVRMVLLKGFDNAGFKFYTNYDSRKGKELADNPQASLLFFWDPLQRMVRVEGRVEKLSREESTEYFHSRPKPSQIGASVSHQSTVIASRQVLTDKYKEMEEKYADDSAEIPIPNYWGGYILKPSVVEFWQGQTTRLHDRVVFRRPCSGEKINPELTHQGEDGWVFERLSP